MWYINEQHSLHAPFQVKPVIVQEFKLFVEEEVFLLPSLGYIDDLYARLKKDIFFKLPCNTCDVYFMNFVFCYFYEKNKPITTITLKEFFNDVTSNPLHILLSQNNHLFALIKQACHFLGSIHPSKEEKLWEKYLIDHSQVFTEYFISHHYLSLLEEKKSIVLKYVTEMQELKDGLLLENKVYDLYIPALLNTSLICTKSSKKEKLIKELFYQKVLNPIMLFSDGYSTQNLFEHAMNHPRDNIWWIKEMLLNFSDYFNFEEMHDYFQKNLVSASYLDNFILEKNNYKEILKMIEQIASKEKIDNSLIKKEKNKITKI